MPRTRKAPPASEQSVTTPPTAAIDQEARIRLDRIERKLELAMSGADVPAELKREIDSAHAMPIDDPPARPSASVGIGSIVRYYDPRFLPTVDPMAAIVIGRGGQLDRWHLYVLVPPQFSSAFGVCFRALDVPLRTDLDNVGEAVIRQGPFLLAD